MDVKGLSELELLEHAEKRFGRDALAKHLRVKPNQINVYRLRGGFSAKRRLIVERLLAPPARATDAPMEARYFTACALIMARMKVAGDADALRAIFDLASRIDAYWDDAEDRRKILGEGHDSYPGISETLAREGLL